MWVIPVFCKNGSMEPKFTFATLGGLVDESANYCDKRLTFDIKRLMIYSVNHRKETTTKQVADGVVPVRLTSVRGGNIKEEGA